MFLVTYKPHSKDLTYRDKHRLIINIKKVIFIKAEYIKQNTGKKGKIVYVQYFREEVFGKTNLIFRTQHFYFLPHLYRFRKKPLLLFTHP